eukprot:13661645-Ditylum_brightwellii.AAC.1
MGHLPTVNGCHSRILQLLATHTPWKKSALVLEALMLLRSEQQLLLLVKFLVALVVLRSGGSFGDAASLETTVSFRADAEPGICSLVLTAEGVSSSTKVIVVDPSGAFVTGGGYIISPEGAYPAQPSLIAPASFGFVSNYKKGHSIPTGDTQFEFEAAGLEFVSTSYEWLVVTGSDCAKYKGA